MVQASDTRSHAGSARQRWGKGCPPEPLGLCAGRRMPHGPPAWQEAHGSWEGGEAAAPQPAPGGLAPGASPRGARRVSVTPCVCLLRLSDARGRGALERSRAAGGVGGEPPAPLSRAVGGLGPGLGRALPRRWPADGPVAPAPGEARGPVLVVMLPARLPRLTSPPRSTPSRLGPARGGVPLMPSAGGARSGCTGARSLALRLVGACRMTPPSPQRSLVRVWPLSSRVIRRDDPARQRRHGASLPCRRERWLWDRRVGRRAWKRRGPPVHQAASVSPDSAASTPASSGAIAIRGPVPVLDTVAPPPQ